MSETESAAEEAALDVARDRILGKAGLSERVIWRAAWRAGRNYERERRLLVDADRQAETRISRGDFG